MRGDGPRGGRAVLPGHGRRDVLGLLRQHAGADRGAEHVAHGFADDAAEAARAAEAIAPIEVNGQRCRSILVEEKSPIAQEYFVAITWDGRAKRPVCVFSDMGGIDIEEVAETHPEHVSKTHFSTIRPLTPRIAKEAVAATGVTGSDLNKLAPIVFKLMQIFLEYDLTLAEINPLAKLADGRFLVLDGHIDMEAEARGEHKALLAELGHRRCLFFEVLLLGPADAVDDGIDAAASRGAAGLLFGTGGFSRQPCRPQILSLRNHLPLRLPLHQGHPRHCIVTLHRRFFGRLHARFRGRRPRLGKAEHLAVERLRDVLFVVPADHRRGRVAQAVVGQLGPEDEVAKDGGARPRGGAVAVTFVRLVASALPL